MFHSRSPYYRRMFQRLLAALVPLGILRPPAFSLRNLDTQIRHAGASWKKAEMGKPENQRFQHNFIGWIQALQQADALIYQVGRLSDSAPAWRRHWSPETPYEMHRAYDCVYAHAIGLIEDERVSPARVVETLQEQLKESKETFAELAGDDEVEG
ncbi:hypothetical protein IAQ61_000731 [Plenodomus lingam]|uniref:uncharacterized protein n=1 Tax=Leptosphaeria maculans TaxID=5022 RepID=UPI003328EFEC|nr:hypothetical protein IAQ61_000731 [Plenodomus lingam]